MAASLWIEVGGVDYSAYIKADTCKPRRAGPGVVGGADVTLEKAGGGLTAVQPLAPVKLARLDGSGHFERRLIYGVVVVPGLRQELGTNIAYYDLKCTDSNIVGRALRVPVGTTIHLASANFDVQVADLVTQVQAAYGGSYEALDTSQVPNLHSAMPVADLEGGHELDWYLAQIEQTVRDLTSGAVDPAHYWGVDDTAGPTTFGLVTLQYYDRLGSSLSVLSLTDSNNTLRSWKRPLDAATYYYRREAVYTGGVVEAVVGTPLANPWQGGQWKAPPLKVDTADAGTALALVQADILHNGALRETIRGVVRQLTAQAGDTVDWTLALAGLSGYPTRVVDTTTDFLAASADLPEMELTTGTIPRRLGESGRTAAGGVVLRDVVPPDPPASAPTAPTNAYDPVRRLTEFIFRSVSSVSADVGALRARYVVNTDPAAYSDWVPVPGPAPSTADFPALWVPPLVPGGSGPTTVTVDVQARDTSGNESTFGPADTFTAAQATGPNPPTIGVPSIKAYHNQNGVLYYSATFRLTNPGANLGTWYSPEHFAQSGPHRTDPETPVPANPPNYVDYTLYELKPNINWYFWVRARDDAYNFGSYATYGPFTVGSAVGNGGVAGFELADPDSPAPGGLLGWTADTSGGATITLGTSNVYRGTTSVRITY